MKMKVYNKGQVILPASIRKKYNINIGDKVDVLIEKDGIKIIPVKKVNVTDELFGIINKQSYNYHEPSNEEIYKVTEEEFIKGWKKNESN